MSSEAFADQRALSVRNRQPILIGDDAIPEGADVANFVFRRKFIETWRRNWKSVCHVERIASDGGLDNPTKRQPFRRPPNVPPLSSGRIRKPEGIRRGRASPRSSAGDRAAVKDTTRHGRLLQRLVGQPVTESVSWLSSARSFWLSILEGAVSQGSSGNAAGKEGARDVASLKASSGGSPAQEVQPVLGRRSGLGGAGKERTVLQGRTLSKPIARPSPWYFTTGERHELNRCRGSLAITRAGGNGAVSLSSPVAEDEAGRTVCKTPNALLVLGQPDRTARQPRPPVNPISSSSADRR